MQNLVDSLNEDFSENNHDKRQIHGYEMRKLCSTTREVKFLNNDDNFEYFPLFYENFPCKYPTTSTLPIRDSNQQGELCNLINGNGCFNNHDNKRFFAIKPKGDLSANWKFTYTNVTICECYALRKIRNY